MANPPLWRSKSLNQANLIDEARNLKELKCPKLWMQKKKAVFNIYDPERTGKISIGNLTIFVDRFRKYGKLTDEQAERIHVLLKNWMEDILKDHKEMTFEEFVKMSHIALNNPAYKEDHQKYLTDHMMDIFSVIDTSGNNVISKKEWRVFFHAAGHHDEIEADRVFEEIDLNQNGVLSREEFVKAALKFDGDQEPGPFDHFLGPLDDLSVAF